MGVITAIVGLIVLATVFVTIAMCFIYEAWPFGRKERKMRKYRELSDRVSDLESAAVAEVRRKFAIACADEENARIAELKARRSAVNSLIRDAVWNTREIERYHWPLIGTYSKIDNDLEIVLMERMQKMLDAGLLKMVKSKTKKK